MADDDDEGSDSLKIAFANQFVLCVRLHVLLAVYPLCTQEFVLTIAFALCVRHS